MQTASFFVYDTAGNFGASAPLYIGTICASIVTVLFLLVFLRTVRRQRRDLLTLIYVYSIATSLIAILVVLTHWAIVEPLRDSVTSTIIALTVTSLFVEFAVVLPITLWFARQASAMGLVYAYFLVLIGGLAFSHATPIYSTTVLENYMDISRAELTLIATLVSCFASVIVALVGVWLLGNFEFRGPSFRKWTVIALYAYAAYTYLGGHILLSLFLGPIGLTFAPLTAVVALLIFLEIGLIYLVRIRRPPVPSMS